MIETKKLLLRLSKRFPKSIAKKWNDHVGLMTGKLPNKINKVLLCLDLDEEIYDIVKKEKPDVIITHHPFIYGTKKQVFSWDKKKEAYCKKIDKLGIPVLSYHTNFDEGKGGMNDALASKLGLNDIYQAKNQPMMRVGTLDKEMDIEEFAKYAKDKLDVTYGLLIPNGATKIKKVGIIGGGGSGFWRNAKEEECDIYISGDAPHHVRRDIATSGYSYLDLPHEIEKIFVPTMKKILLEMDPSLVVVEVDHEKLPKIII